MEMGSYMYYVQEVVPQLECTFMSICPIPLLLMYFERIPHVGCVEVKRPNIKYNIKCFHLHMYISKHYESKEIVLYYMNTYLLLHVLVMPLIIFTNLTVEFPFSLFSLIV